MNITRRTLKNSFHLSGLGLHTGVPVNLSVHPGSEGIAFRLGAERTLAIPANVSDTTRSTRLGSVGTIEHLMSAFAGLGITDAEVEVDAPEIPGMDGSAAAYVEAILKVGLEESGDQEVRNLFTRIFHQEDETKVAVAKGHGHWRYVYDLGTRWPNQQSFELMDVSAGYVEEIASARTFALAEEIPLLIEHGLGKGLDYESALILGIEGYKNEARFPDEPARHKLLDIIGDLYLAGVPISMLSVVGERSGHRTNVAVAAMLRQAVWG